MSLPSASAAVIALALAAATLLPAQELRIEPSGCDSLKLVGDGSGWERLEEDRGEGWNAVAEARALPTGLSRTAPEAGRSQAWRFVRSESLRGLPEYSREWSWSRPWPELAARLDGGRLLWDSSGECRPDRLELRLYDGERPVDLRLLEAAAGRENLPATGWTLLRLGWPGQPQPLELRAHGGIALAPADGPAPLDPPAVRLPPTPQVLAAGGGWIELVCEGQPRLLAGKGRFEALGGGRWRLEAPGAGECWIAACVQDTLCGLPLLWIFDDPAAEPQLERQGPGALRVTAPAAPVGAEWHWLDASGQGGRASGTAPLLLSALAGSSLQLQLVGGDGALIWTRRLSLEWDPPQVASWRSRGLAEPELLLEDPRGWATGVELEIRRPGGDQRLQGTLRLALPPLAEDSSWTLRWRGRAGASASRWTPWITRILRPETPSELELRPARRGLELRWTPAAWLEDGLEWRRICGADTVLLPLSAGGSRLDEGAPFGDLCRYQARRLAGSRASAWSALLPAYVPDDGRGWPLGPGGRWQPRTLRVGEARAFFVATGCDWPQALPVEGREDWFRRWTLPMVALTPIEALEWVNWLNEQHGYSARHDLVSGDWSAGDTGGFRVPPADWVAPPLAPEDPAVLQWRCVEGGFVLAGRSWLRGEAGSRRHGLRESAIDAGLRLVLVAP
jgi:hypothetical protein